MDSAKVSDGKALARSEHQQERRVSGGLGAEHTQNIGMLETRRKKHVMGCTFHQLRRSSISQLRVTQLHTFHGCIFRLALLRTTTRTHRCLGRDSSRTVEKSARKVFSYSRPDAGSHVGSQI